MSIHTVIITALPSELSQSKAQEGVRIVYSGVGKINAALATAGALERYKPRRIINFGTAGRVHAGVGGLVEIGAVVQHDMCAMPLAARGTTPFDDTASLLVSGQQGALCATGDSFVTQTDPWLIAASADVVDMELFAIALTCHRKLVPWRAFKFITDDANDDSAHEWDQNVSKGEALFWDAFAGLHIG